MRTMRARIGDLLRLINPIRAQYDAKRGVNIVPMYSRTTGPIFGAGSFAVYCGKYDNLACLLINGSLVLMAPEVLYKFFRKIRKMQFT